MPELQQGDEPIFVALAAMIADGILTGRYQGGEQVPSTTELSVFYRINPATAARALNSLAERGVLVKRRGLGMFVTPDAHTILHNERESALLERYVDPLLREASLLGIDMDSLTALMKDRASGYDGDSEKTSEKERL